ncbi:hypothetical protein [Streptomyces sp. CB01881]|uniref:hypothetical protein n=1 Tax=Streptomyces sp. CB01881 TaxID=2078691 RepID=UPI0011DFC937|nr:hypothetical protein [Streptomyces sp. CB01881]TYC76579.1 hypothetical protein EH183_02945 [Streptomyces sp. CB01881]
MTTRLSVLRLTAVMAAVVMAVLVGLSGCSGSDSGKGGNGPRATSSPPADETAANGPLVGTPSLVAGEQSCAAAEGNAPWFPTIAAFEVHDSNRTHLYACAHFPGAQSNNQVFAHSSDQVYVTPYNIVDRGPNELYVYGGGYGDNPAASGSFVSRVEPGTFNEVWRRVLINTNATDEWNYPGVLNTLADGSLVVIYGYHIARIDPANGNVLAQTTLPTGQSAPRDTAYNGYDALPDGTIVAKTVNRQPGCTEQGFSAFLDCPDPTAVPPSILVAIDPKSLRVLSQVTLPEMMGGRITTTVFNGTGQIYLPGATKLYRYSYPNGAFAPDPTWGPVSYLQNGQTAASAMAVINDYVVAMTNGGKPTPTPMSVVAVSQADSTKVATVQPFANSGAKQSFIPSMVSVDPENNRVYAMDAGAGKLAGIDLANGALSVAWSQDQTTLSFTTLLGPKDQRVLIGTDIPVKFFQGLKTYSTEQVVWRDAGSGAELARSSQLPKMTQGILVTPGYAGLQYFLTADGHVIGLQVAPKPASPSPSPASSGTGSASGTGTPSGTGSPSGSGTPAASGSATASGSVSASASASASASVSVSVSASP